jgi:hypothetical protein
MLFITSRVGETPSLFMRETERRCEDADDKFPEDADSSVTRGRLLVNCAGKGRLK